EVKTYRIDDLTFDGNAALLNGGDNLEAKLDVGGLFSEPLEGPFAIKLDAHGQGDQRNATLSVEAPGAKVLAEANLSGTSDVDAFLKQLDVDPSFLRAFVPAYPVEATLHAEGEVHKRTDDVDAELHAHAGSSKLNLTAKANLAQKEVSKLSARLSGVNFAQLVEDGPKSDVSLSLDAHGGGSSADDAHGELTLTAPAATMGNQPFGPIDVHATVKEGVATIEKFLAKLPGVEVHAHGTASKENVNVTAGVIAKSLESFSKTVGALAGPGKLDLGGHGQATFAAKGPTENPSVHLEASFPKLRVQKRDIEDLVVNAELPQAKDPFGLNARVDARHLSLGKRGLSDLHAGVKSKERHLTVEAHARGFLVLSVALDALTDTDHKGLELNQLTLSWPEETWKLEAPSHLRFDEKELSATPLALVAGDQRIALHGKKHGDDVDGHVEVKKLDIGKLPKLVLNPLLNLGGTLSVTADASGTTRKPELQAHVDLKNGSYKQFQNLSLGFDGQYVRDRLTGQLNANGAGMKLASEFDVPFKALKERKREPVRVVAKIEEMDLQRLKASGIAVPFTGTFAMDLTVKGMASDPKLNFAFKGKNLVYEALPPTNVDLVAKSGEDSKLMARLDVSMLEKKGFAQIDTPWSLSTLIVRAPTANDVMHAPLRLQADFKQFPLPMPYISDITDELVMGDVTLSADVKGPLLAPHGKVHAFLDGLSRGHSPVLEASLDATAQPDGIRVNASAVRQKDKKKILDLVAKMEAPIAKLRNPNAIASLPVLIDGTVGPIAVEDLRALMTPPKQAGAHVGLRIDQPALEGELTAKLEGRGTLGDPKLSLRSAVKGLGKKDVQKGDVQLSYDYANSKHVLQLSLKSGNSGELKIDGKAIADISYGGMQKGLDVPAIPLDVKLAAHDFDPQFLSAATPKLRSVGGAVDATAQLTGTPTKPMVNGRIEWKNGQASIAGSGNYEAIHVLIEGNNQRVELKELTAKSADGEAKLYALAEDVGSGKLKLTAKADLKEFPIISEDQLMANVSARGQLSGSATMRLMNIDRLQIDEAHVLLPDIKRKNLQPLDEPKDVVFTKRGKRIDDDRKKKAQQVAANESGTGGSGAQAMPEKKIDPSQFQIRARIYGPRNIWIKAKDINAEVGFSDGFRVLYAGAPQLFGDVVVHRGRLDVFGRRFDFQRDSKMTFGGPPEEPNLDVTALHVNEREDVKVNLKVSGPAKKLEIHPTSDPPLSDTEIYTLLATGRRSLRPGSGGASNSNPAASVVGSLAASQLKKTVASALPLDVLSIEAGDNGLEGSKLEAGTYVNDKLYLGFTGRVGANPLKGENSNAVKLEYQLTKRWSFQAEYGDAKAGGADLIWSKEY
ncbi:MAG: translocation/assembly module TamB domain-containing protein, partial [Myxococcaceae bacterium]